jgi:hypothetical protein
MARKYGWSAKVRDHRTGETGSAHGVTEGGPDYTKDQAREDVAEFVRERARLHGHVATPYDIELEG